MKDPALIDRLKELGVWEPIGAIADYMAGLEQLPPQPHGRTCDGGRFLAAFASEKAMVIQVERAHVYALAIEEILRYPGGHTLDLVNRCREFRGLKPLG